MSFSSYDSKPWLARYADYVPEELPPPEKSMVDLFEASASRAPEQDAIRYFDAAVSRMGAMPSRKRRAARICGMWISRLPSWIRMSSPSRRSLTAGPRRSRAARHRSASR